MKEKSEKKQIVTMWTLTVLIIVLIAIIVGLYVKFIQVKKQVQIAKEQQMRQMQQEQATISNDNNAAIAKEDTETEKDVKELDYRFLKLENTEKNKIYSPLSIKYALKMLEEGATGESKKQIAELLGNKTVTKYTSGANMSLANALFVNSEFNSIKEDYINTLKNKYDAEVKLDTFENADSINAWISEKTLNLIKNATNSISQEQKFILINALGIDMDWEEKFILRYHLGDIVEYEHEEFAWGAAEDVLSHEFENMNEKISGMEVKASVNNYDIIKDLGEENIRKTVGDAFVAWAKGLDNRDWDYRERFNSDLSEENINKEKEKYLEKYIKEIGSNYKAEDSSTDFSLYVDDDVKVFAKDLKEYNGTTLQYVGIMPIREKLSTYVENVTETGINKIIKNLKSLKCENFKDGVITKITGYIPKFNFEYEVNLMEDLKALGITNAFEEGEAELLNICEEPNIYINETIHKANIEFTQDGIKAAAATMIGGAGAGSPFDYIYDVPVEEIDLTFDKPFMFIIRDKNTGEVWFTGTVYEPLLWKNDTTKARPDKN